MAERQPRVAPESLTWFVSYVVAEAWAYEGRVLGKAHTLDAAEKGAICGAPMYPPYEPAETGFPACRHCTKRDRSSVPAVFYGFSPTPREGAS